MIMDILTDEDLLDMQAQWNPVQYEDPKSGSYIRDPEVRKIVMQVAEEKFHMGLKQFRKMVEDTEL